MWIFSPKWWRDRALNKVRPERSKIFKSGSIIKARRGKSSRGRKNWEVEVSRVSRGRTSYQTSFGIIWYRSDGSYLEVVNQDLQTAWNYMENNSVDEYDREKIVSEQLKEEKSGTEILEFELHCIFLPEYPKSIYAGFALEDDCMSLLSKVNIARQHKGLELAYWKHQTVRYPLTIEHLSNT
jgi:hypothetical protein